MQPRVTAITGSQKVEGFPPSSLSAHFKLTFLANLDFIMWEEVGARITQVEFLRIRKFSSFLCHNFAIQVNST